MVKFPCDNQIQLDIEIELIWQHVFTLSNHGQASKWTQLVLFNKFWRTQAMYTVSQKSKPLDVC